MYSLLRQKASTLEEPLLHFASDLIRTPSPSFGEKNVADKVEQKMNELGYDRVIRDAVGNVAGVMFGREYSPTLLMVSHMDTNSTEDQVDENDFLANSNKFFGRGSSDSKSGLASQMYAGRLLKESMIPLQGNLIVVATVGEHCGCNYGIRHFLSDTLPSFGLTPSFAVLGEPTDLGLYYGHDGWVKVTMRLHHPEIDNVKNAANALYGFLNKGTVSYSLSTQPLQEIAVDTPVIEKCEDGHTATLTIDHRIRSSREILHMLRRLKSSALLVSKPYALGSIKVEIAKTNARISEEKQLSTRLVSFPWMTDPLHPLFEEVRLALRTAQCEVRGGTWTFEKLGMGTAGSVLTQTFGIPTIGYGPGNERCANTSEEYVEIDKLKEAFFGSAVIAHRLIGVPTAGLTRVNDI